MPGTALTIEEMQIKIRQFLPMKVIDSWVRQTQVHSYSRSEGKRLVPSENPTYFKIFLSGNLKL